MHIRNTKLSKALALLAALLVVASFVINKTTLAGTTSCVIVAAGGTGCFTPTGVNCSWYSPNYGVTWYQNEQCTYNGNRVTGDTLVGTCSASPNNGCCNNLDPQQHCPGAHNCPDGYTPPGCRTGGP